MCILCVASRWSRRIVTMLPWLIIPLIILWALSQLLPPGFRFEVTSPRLACVAVLLVSLGWYELVMPRLSSWRAHRSALLRERRRIELQEAAKWRKEATRRCRNCLTAYKDQTPGGGKFMCTYCGHVSKRPVLDIPGGSPGSISPGIVVGNMVPGGGPLTGGSSASGLVNGGGYYVGKNSRGWSAKGLPDRAGWGGGKGWMAGRPWANEGGGWGVNGSWFGGSWAGGVGAGVWGGPGASFGGSIFGVERCAAGESYSGVFFFVLRILSYGFVCLGWVWRKLWKIGHSGESLNGGLRTCQRKVEDGGTSHGTRGEKARRKAEEKRQARLEREQLEAEERKQREEVARLVEERRRQRDEKLEAEKESEREAAAERDREIRREREAERRRQEKVREREKGLAKDRPKEQDPEEVKKKKSKENEKRTESEKNEKREDQKSILVNGLESRKGGKVFRPSGQETGSKGVDASLQGASGNALKLGAAKHLGSSKSISSGSNFGGKPGKTGTPIVSSSSNVNLNASSNGKVAKVSSSAWNRISWTKVWGKGSASEETSKIQLGVMDGSGERSEGKNQDEAKHLIDGTIISSFSTAPVGAPQPPIAPPSSQGRSWHRLFSSPSVFPPIGLSVDSGNLTEQKPQDAVKSQGTQPLIASSSLTQGHILFGTSAPVPLQSLDPFSVQVPLVISTAGPLATSVQTTVTSPVHLTPSGLHIGDNFGCVDMHDPLSLLGPVSDALLTSLPIDLGTSVSPSIDSNSLLPMDAHISAPAHLPLLNQPQIPINLKPGEGDGHFGEEPLHQILEPWGLPPLSLENSCNIVDEGRWEMWGAPQLHQLNFPKPSPWLVPPNDMPVEHANDSLEPVAQSTLQSAFEPETQLPSCLYSPRKQQESSKESSGDLLGLVPVSNSNNIWSDSSIFETICGWDDEDIHHRMPPEFVDCITKELMQDPVITADGHSYERSAIETWLKSHDTSPKTGEVLPPPPGGNGIGVDKTLRPNHILRGQIIEYKERLARGSGLQDGQKEGGWSTALTGSTSWSATSSTATRPHIGGFYTTPGVQSVWSYNLS